MPGIRIGARRTVLVRRLVWFLALTTGLAARVEADGPWFARRQPARPLVPAGAVQPAPDGSVNTAGRLGTFYPTPYMMVRGNAPIGGGYSPLDAYGDTTLSLYGPLSSLRMTSAPVVTYTRGYNGSAVVQPGTSFSAPNLPSLTPVVNPTSASYYYGFRSSGSPPWWASGMNWIDQN